VVNAWAGPPAASPSQRAWRARRELLPAALPPGGAGRPRTTGRHSSGLPHESVRDAGAPLCARGSPTRPALPAGSPRERGAAARSPRARARPRWRPALHWRRSPPRPPRPHYARSIWTLAAARGRCAVPEPPLAVVRYEVPSPFGARSSCPATSARTPAPLPPEHVPVASLPVRARHGVPLARGGQPFRSTVRARGACPLAEASLVAVRTAPCLCRRRQPGQPAPPAASPLRANDRGVPCLRRPAPSARRARSSLRSRPAVRREGRRRHCAARPERAPDERCLAWRWRRRRESRSGCYRRSRCRAPTPQGAGGEIGLRSRHRSSIARNRAPTGVGERVVKTREDVESGVEAGQLEDVQHVGMRARDGQPHAVI
jgi:hypothetical protein